MIFFIFYFVQIYTLNLNLLATAPPRKEQKNGTFRPCSSLFLYLLQSGFSRQLSYKCDVTAKKLRVHFIHRLPVLVMAHRSMPLDEWFKMRTWLVSFPSLNGVRGGAGGELSRFCVIEWSQKPHVFVEPRGALCPVQRLGEIRGAGRVGVSSALVQVYLFSSSSFLLEWKDYVVNLFRVSPQRTHQRRYNGLKTRCELFSQQPELVKNPPLRKSLTLLNQ